MNNQLVVQNIPTHLASNLYVEPTGSLFVLKTCQRILLINNCDHQLNIHEGEVFYGKEAYSFLMETICGLKSRLVGENEIVNQFKTAYQSFMSLENKNPFIIRTLEKLFKDAKEIRTDYLLGISQKSYASIARRHILLKKPEQVLILGSGILAEDMINQLKKKVDVILCARNSEKVAELCLKHNVKAIPWGNLDQISNYPQIINTIGCETILFNEKFFYDWYEKTPINHLFIDLGSPSALQTSFSKEQDLLRLENIYEEGAIKDEQKTESINMARVAIESMAKKRITLINEQQNASLS